MKFKWIGGNGFKDIDLVLNGVMKPNQQLFKGTIIDIPDDKQDLIRRVKINANYELFIEPKPKKKFTKPKKEQKKEEIQEELKENEQEE